MNNWTVIMILGIVAITSIARVLRAKYQSQHGIIEDGKGQIQMLARPDDSELQREVLELRERIKVLERIATDANSLEQRQTRSIAAEIESLRDR